MMRGETSPTFVTAEQIIQWGPALAIEVAKQLRDRAAELAEWDEDDKAGEPPGFRRRALCWTPGCILQNCRTPSDASQSIAAWEADGSPLDPEKAAMARCVVWRGDHELLSRARDAETWIAAAVEKYREQWADKSPGYSPWVSALVDAGGVSLLLSYAPLLVPLLGPSARPTHLKPGS